MERFREGEVALTDLRAFDTVADRGYEVSDAKTGRNGSPVFETIQRAVMDSVTAERATIVQSGVRSLNAANAEVHQTAVQRLTADQATFDRSAVVSARVREASLRNSAAVTLVAGSVSAQDCRTVFLVSPSVSGSVRAVVTPAAAFAFGVGYFLGRRLLGSLGRRRKE